MIDASGNQMGVVPLAQAIAAAGEAGKDLVEVAPDARPPVCRIMDYGKYKYEQDQKAREAKRKQSSSGLKEMTYRPNIGDADLDTKNRKVAEFIEDGHKVKLTVRLRGRERSKPELARDVIDRIVEELDEVEIEVPAKAEGRTVFAIIS